MVERPACRAVTSLSAGTGDLLESPPRVCCFPAVSQEGEVLANAFLTFGGKSIEPAAAAAMPAADSSRRRRVNLDESERLSAKGIELPFKTDNGRNCVTGW